MTNKKCSKRSRYEEESESERESEIEPIEISDKESEDEENLEKEKGLEKKGSSKERSVVWEHFDKYIDSENVRWAKCRHCR
jgi:hypothetical protein